MKRFTSPYSLFTIALSLCVLCALCGVSLAADTVTQTLAQNGTKTNEYIWSISFIDDTGNDIASTAMDTDIYNKLKGFFIFQVTTDPGAADGPTDGAWDFNLTVAGGTENLLGGDIDNRSATLTEKVVLSNGFFIDELLYFDTDDQAVAGGNAVVEVLLIGR